MRAAYAVGRGSALLAGAGSPACWDVAAAGPDPPPVEAGSPLRPTIDPSSGARDAVRDVAEAAAGDVCAFERLYHAHLPRVHSLVRRMAAGRETDELTQDERDAYKFDNQLREAYVDLKLSKIPLSLRIGRGFYEDGIWADGGFIPYQNIGGLAWREGEQITLVMIYRMRALAKRLVVPQN